MFSVLIPARNQFEDLQKLLGDLTPAAVDGLIREVLVADDGSEDPTADFCEDAGVDLIQGGLVAAAMAAKSDWLLILPPFFRADGERLKALKDFSGGALTHARYGGVKPREFLARPALGLIVRKADLISTSETRDPVVLLKRFSQSARRTI
ncbi:MAG: hypothetical protein CFE28_11365 [Alphaproteobacteria bacterium PA2]|nr:MAG: hypothetical protein CFE28_11365 [Alphaproteobacteria bacterium PA2]